MLEAAVNCLNIGIVGLGIPRRSPRIEASRLVAELGLIGSAGELAVGACLVQAAGVRASLRPSGFYKNAAEIFDDFCVLVASPTPKLDFLVHGVPNPDAHREQIRIHIRKFRLLATLRAAALHAGNAPPRPVCVSLANDVCGFLDLLGRSARIHPYLPEVPRPFEMITEAAILVEDLRRQMASASTISDHAQNLANLFLVLPEVPEYAPDWVEAFDRVAVTPRMSDITLLLKTLDSALPAALRKGKPGSAAITVKVDPSHPGAIPISPHYLRTEFTKTPDRFHADIGNANGRLTDGYFNPPPNESVKELCAIGLDEASVLAAGEELTAHQAWPFIASSLAQSGTPGPIWFLVRRCSDLGQLLALLDRVDSMRPAYFGAHYAEVKTGILAIRDGKKVARKGLFLNLFEFRDAVEQRRDRLQRRIRESEGTDRRLPAELEARVRTAQKDRVPVGPLILDLLDKKLDLGTDAKIYWARILAEVADLREDLPGILSVTRLPGSTGAHTAARKAFQLIDFLESGPDVEAPKP